MDYRSGVIRTGLLLGTAFLAGIAIGPASGLIARHLGYDFGISRPSPRTAAAPTPTGC